MAPTEPVPAGPRAPAEIASAPVSPQFDVGAPNQAERAEQTQTAPVHTVTLKTQLKEKWHARVGKTTFRTTLAQVGHSIVLGTHGQSLNGKNEPSDGVYVIDGATGHTQRTIRTPGTGDLDVGGVAVDGDVVYFTADNAQIAAASLSSGKILWKQAARGKARPAPALGDLNRDGHVDVVVGDESGALRALDGRDGANLWAAATGTNEYGAGGFIAAAAIVDIDGDGGDDVVAGARDGILTAYRGRDGQVIWQVQEKSGMHASPCYADFDQDGRPELLAAWSYGDVAILDARTGTRRWSARLEQDGGGIEGLFGTPVPLAGAPGVLIAPTAWWGEADGIIGVGVDEREFRAHLGRVSASAVVGDLDMDGVNEAVIGTETGKLVALHADGGYSELAQLKGAIEAPALLADVDGNGSVELLVASNDGLLTCFESGSRAPPVIARFRGASNHNRGDFGSVQLGWRSRASSRVQPPQARSPGNVRLDYLVCCTALQQAAALAPAPPNALYLQASAQCNTLAAKGLDRKSALSTLAQALGTLPLPAQCR
ncbi:MAG TPA: PQQ-binding-like beta-propeller repeat protein [Polyangiaceae bacterium]